MTTTIFREKQLIDLPEFYNPPQNNNKANNDDDHQVSRNPLQNSNKTNQPTTTTTTTTAVTLYKTTTTTKPTTTTKSAVVVFLVFLLFSLLLSNALYPSSSKQSTHLTKHKDRIVYNLSVKRVTLQANLGGRMGLRHCFCGSLKPAENKQCPFGATTFVDCLPSVDVLF